MAMWSNGTIYRTSFRVAKWKWKSGLRGETRGKKIETKGDRMPKKGEEIDQNGKKPRVSQRKDRWVSKQRNLGQLKRWWSKSKRFKRLKSCLRSCTRPTERCAWSCSPLRKRAHQPESSEEPKRWWSKLEMMITIQRGQLIERLSEMEKLQQQDIMPGHRHLQTEGLGELQRWTKHKDLPWLKSYLKKRSCRMPTGYQAWPSSPLRHAREGLLTGDINKPAHTGLLISDWWCLLQYLSLSKHAKEWYHYDDKLFLT